MNKLASIFISGIVLGLSGCNISTTPVSQALPPGGHPRLAIVTDVRQTSIGYTDPDVKRAENAAEGPTGLGVFSLVITETIYSQGPKKEAYDAVRRLGKQWDASGRDTGRIVLEEFRKVFTKAGYIMDETSESKLRVSYLYHKVELHGGNYNKDGQFGVVLECDVYGLIANNKYHYSARSLGRSNTTSTLGKLTPAIYERALREAAAARARKVLYGTDDPGKPQTTYSSSIF